RSNRDQDEQGTRSDQHQERTSPLFLYDDDEDGGSVCCIQEGSSSGVVLNEYHILYSCSYLTPVLYFRASTLGMSLCLEDVWDSVHPNSRRRLQNGPWDIITQQVGQSFFVLQPCSTKVFMKPVLVCHYQRQVNYIVTWLSVVGPIVGFDIPLSYSPLTQKC
uniref:Ubiquitin-like-conjugating enzyme ATG10 n=1 Tax=Hucho hucho TaxID=62062 RepID=A0A4W5KE88_9TELE